MPVVRSSFLAGLMSLNRPPPFQRDFYSGPCTVTGALPPWIQGTLYRSGPGLWEVGERQLRHTYDGCVNNGQGAGAMGKALGGPLGAAPRTPDAPVFLGHAVFSSSTTSTWGARGKPPSARPVG